MGKNKPSVDIPPAGAPPTLPGSNIRFLRQLKGLSQQQMAEALGIKRNNIASFESGLVEPRAEVFLAIARFLSVDPVDLLTRDLSRQPPPRASSGAPALLPAELLGSLIRKTAEGQKILEGFREFYKLKYENNQAGDLHFRTLRHDLENLLDLLEQFLKNNRDLLLRIQQESEHSP